MQTWRTRIGLAALMLLFIGSALLFVPRLGIEADEGLIANGIYQRGEPLYSWSFGRFEVPVMILSYLGALKSWIYSGLFAVWTPTALSLRLPMIMIGAATLWLFFALLDRMAGRTAAWIGASLLATDTSFVLIEATDFGFVALQFLFKLGALLLLLRFHRAGDRRALAGAFLLLGLALWDKAVFVWVLFGLAAATVLIFPRELRKASTARNVGIAALAITAGALPLVVYNVARPFDTIRANAALIREPFVIKAILLSRTLNGYVMFDFMTAAEPGPRPREPRRRLQKMSAALARWTGHPQQNLTIPALLLATTALAFLWRTPARRTMLFALLAFTATWLAMVLTAGAGGAAHHVILLWPFQFVVIAVALSRVPLTAAIAGTILISGASLAVTNEYYAEVIRNGPAIRWTDAIYPLDRYLAKLKAPGIFIADWGILETLNLLSEGDTPVIAAEGADSSTMNRMLENPAYVFVAHTAAFAIHPLARTALEATAQQTGYREERIDTIYDRNGRATFEIFRFRKVHL